LYNFNLLILHFSHSLFPHYLLNILCIQPHHSHKVIWVMGSS
jgi:hypothetical protein